MNLVRVATCNLNQWAMDFDGNLANIKQSIVEAKARGCSFRTGPELEIPGFGCQDHFLESDTLLHAWESLLSLLQSGVTNGILCDVGLPVLHLGVRYNCRAFCLDGRILLLRPKTAMCDDGNYRESRWFSPWTRFQDLDSFSLPPIVARATGQRECPFGCALLKARDTMIASETCEELFTAQSPHIAMGLNGAEIIANGSASHHNLRKLRVRLDLINSATAKGGGAYLYSNQQGCDGGRLYYDGCACVSVNGQLVKLGSQFSLDDVEVVDAVIDLDDIRSFRAQSPSRSFQASNMQRVPTVSVDFSLAMSLTGSCSKNLFASHPVAQDELEVTPQQEIALGPACWLWDYLRRSGSSGFFLPLSGGADSSATAALVGSMSQLVVKACREGNKQVLRDVRRIVGESEEKGREGEEDGYVPTDAVEFCGRILHTTYMGMAENSSKETRARAASLAKEIGSYHKNVDIDFICDAFIATFALLFGKEKTPKFKVHGGTTTENLALQNIQARSRMVLSYLLAQLLPWVRGRKGWLLVLGSANVDEALRGYMTKYDCSSADINPIGGISKTDLKSFLLWASSPSNLNYPTLADVVAAPPSAELEPLTESHVQTDEEDMGFTYDELSMFGRVRKLFRAGPVTAYMKLRGVWKDRSAADVAAKVKSFFFYYSVNRHKMTTLTPSYHAENYSPDDNRFDLRQFLYNVAWPRQFRTVDGLAKQEEEAILAKETLDKKSKM